MMVQPMAIWRRLRSADRQPEFTGAPAVRRIKTYSAQSGYAYQYYFGGSRVCAGSKEYSFHVATDSSTFHVFVRLSEQVLNLWETAGGHPLNPTEQYGIAKMAFFEHLDT